MWGGTSSDKSVLAIAPHGSHAFYTTDISSIHATHQSSYMLGKHISDVEAIGHDHVEETKGYEHTVKVMSAIMEPMRHERPEKTHYHF